MLANSLIFFIILSFISLTIGRIKIDESKLTCPELFEGQYKVISQSTTNDSLIITIAPRYTNASITESYTLRLRAISNSIAQFVIKESTSARFELPYKPPFPYHNSSISFSSNDRLYYFHLQSEPFILSIIRKSTNEILFRTPFLYPFLFLPNFAQIKTFIPTDDIYGFGERTTNFKLQSGLYTLFNKDNPDLLDYGIGDNNNRYGSHPMYLMREHSGYYHISYLRNGFPMDIQLNTKAKTLQYNIAGGILDFSLFLGNRDPENVIEDYHQFLGGWIMPPFWSMGFHQSRWGYKNVWSLRKVLESFHNHSIPIDSLWLDIDYMVSSHSCSWKETDFNSIQFKQLYNEYSMRYVLISEPTIGLKTEKWVKFGEELSVFIKEPNDISKPLLNKAWSGKSYFIDYFNPNASILINKCNDFLHNKSNYSGIWLDMNEIATFDNGHLDMDEYELPCNDTIYPYYPGQYLFHHKTICSNAIHFNNYTNIQLHNYYASQQCMITYEYLSNKSETEYPFVLSRANAPGVGKYTFLWSGDNGSNSTWYTLSLSEVFNMNLFGIPMSGADVCGFSGLTNEFLCSKWYQIGSLFPFFRSHRHHNYSDTEPYSMGELLKMTSRASIKFRYSILKYYYSLFILKKNKGTIFRPLFFEFYNDNITLRDYIINQQFMIGKDLMCIPNMNSNNKTELIGYFPRGEDWYDLHTFEVVPKNGYNMIYTDMMTYPAVYLRGGRAMFLNDVKKVFRTFQLNNEFIFYLSFKYYQKLVYYCEGTIPAIGDYNNKHNIDQCLTRDCFITIKATYDMKENHLEIVFNGGGIASKDYTGFYIKQLYLMFPFNFLNYKIEKSTLIDIEIRKKNSNCLIVDFKKVIRVVSQSIINLYFK